jgi:hypothetical protein
MQDFGILNFIYGFRRFQNLAHLGLAGKYMTTSGGRIDFNEGASLYEIHHEGTYENGPTVILLSCLCDFVLFHLKLSNVDRALSYSPNPSQDFLKSE